MTRAVALAEAMGGRAIRFDDWEEEFRDLDILVSSTAAPHAIVTRAKIEPILRMRRIGRFSSSTLQCRGMLTRRSTNWTTSMYMIWIRSQAIADRTIETRKKEAEACDGLIEKHVCDFEAWLNRILRGLLHRRRSSARKCEDDNTWDSRQPVGVGPG